MAKAFIVVGHSNWGKSKTLKALTGGKVQFRYYRIAEREFLIKRMSNDDYSEAFKVFCESLNSIKFPHVLLTLCPDFDEPLKYAEASLRVLRDKYELFFFVLKYKFNSSISVNDREVDRLKKYGLVFNYDNKSEAKERAEALKRYIQANIVLPDKTGNA